MKKNDGLIVVYAVIYSFLFFGEKLGINLLLFTVVLIVGFVLRNKMVMKNKNWLVAALATLISGCSVAYFGSALAICSNFVSIMILSGMSVSKRTSVFFSFIYSISTLFCSPYFFVKDFLSKMWSQQNDSKWKRKFALFTFPVIILMVFILLYKGSNPLFSMYVDKINLDWISWGWIFTTLFGMLLVFALYNPFKINELEIYDEATNLKIEEGETKELLLLNKVISQKDEYSSGKILFILLNVLIAFVNMIDFNFMFVTKVLPEGITYAEYIHQGVGMLIVSILFSITIILFYFRGQTNFEKSKTLKSLAYVWIAQNIFMLCAVAMKNNLYIEHYGLTYKRIGVYFYAFLTAVGLLTTIVKIARANRDVYLVRSNGWSFFLVFIISSVINWDQLIVEHNTQNKQKADIYYILSMSDNTLPQLIQYERHIKDPKLKKIYHHRLSCKITNFQVQNSKRTWKSWVYAKNEIKDLSIPDIKNSN